VGGALRWAAIVEGAIVVEPLPRRRAAGGAPRRVPRWAPLAEDLEAWRSESGGSGNKAVFTAPGKPWSLDLATWRDETYPHLARETGLDNVQPSRLRHVYCVLLINGGATLEEVAVLTDEPPEELHKAFGRLLDDAADGEPDPPEEMIRVTREVPSG
jgi:integrase